MLRSSNTGMSNFIVIWFGQLVSLVGTAMTQFALTIWVWQQTGQATTLALMGFFAFAPTILLSPLAGALVDRLDRKLVMMLSDLGAGLATIVIFVLMSADSLQLWHLYALAAWTSAFSAFQFPAYSAAISTMLDKSQYTRASGLMSVAESGSSIAAPVIAGALLVFVGIEGVLLIDIVTFLIALATLVFAKIPRLEPTPNETKASLWSDFLFGFKYIYNHKPLLAVQLVFFSFNIVATFSYFMIAPLILARTGSSELILGTVQSAMGIGGLVGGILLSVWGGPKKRIHGVLISMAVFCFLGSFLFSIGQSGTRLGLVFWIIGAIFSSGVIPIMNGSNQAIWQSKVALNLQGRVFAARRLIAQLSNPIAMIIAGLVADRIFEPAMQEGGSLVNIFSPLLGSGDGAGIAVMFLLSSIAGVIIVTIAYSSKHVTEIESLLPDHDE